MGFVNRKSNYELMRIVAMLMIIMGHFWGQSNYAELATGYSYYLGGILSHGSRIAVNVFLFMGIWFMLEGEFKASRILKLYFNVAAIASIASIAGFYISGGIELILFMRGFLPILGHPLWFAVTYMALQAVSPWLKKIVDGLPRHSLKKLLWLLFLFISVKVSLQNVIEDYWLDTFSWFCFSYLLIGYYKIYMFDKLQYSPNKILLLGIVIYTTLVCMTFYGGIIGKFASLYLGDYKSVPNLIISLSLFYYFQHLDIGYSKIVNLVASGAFSVYIFHQTPAFIHVLWFDIFKCERGFYSIGPVKYMLCVTFLVYLIALILDILRRKYVEPIIMKSKLYLQLERKINEFYKNV